MAVLVCARAIVCARAWGGGCAHGCVRTGARGGCGGILRGARGGGARVGRGAAAGDRDEAEVGGGEVGGLDRRAGGWVGG
jgi:hypothetical protein